MHRIKNNNIGAHLPNNLNTRSSICSTPWFTEISAQAIVDGEKEIETSDQELLHHAMCIAISDKKEAKAKNIFKSIKEKDNISITTGITYLEQAISGNCTLDMIQSLIDSGASTDIKTSHSISILGFAVYKNRLDIVQFLIENDTCQCKSSETPLHIAIQKHYNDIASFLIKNKTDLSMSYLEHAMEHENSELCCKLINKITFDAKKVNKIIIAAIDKNMHEELSYFLNKYMDNIYINNIDKNGNTYLINAIVKARVTIAEILLSYNLDVSIANKKGETALVLACKYKQIDKKTKLVELILKKDPSPILTAVKNENYTIAINLLSSKIITIDREQATLIYKHATAKVNQIANNQTLKKLIRELTKQIKNIDCNQKIKKVTDKIKAVNILSKAKTLPNITNNQSSPAQNAIGYVERNTSKRAASFSTMAPSRMISQLKSNSNDSEDSRMQMPKI